MLRCGYTLVDKDGEDYPCNRKATGWRWYQDVEHEDALDVACYVHENEGGRRIHEADVGLAKAWEEGHASHELPPDEWRNPYRPDPSG